MPAYFDKPANEADKAAYYSNLDPADPEFSVRLSVLLRETHTTQLSYKPALHLYPLVDRQESGKLFSIYSGKEFTLEELLMMDAQVDIERQEMIDRLAKDKFGRPLTIEEEQEILFRKPYNCEHVVCQSWFGSKSPMVGDLHHLFTCEETCNSFRNNYKYTDFSDYRDVIKEECGNLKDGLFEPERNKGIVARAVLYFLLRYPGGIKVYDGKDLEMLKKWHREQAVTLFELHRNQCIFAVQKNRNPLIDRPDWVERIKFDRL